MPISELETLTAGNHYYSDIPSSFAKSKITNDLAASYDLRAIQESLLGIISTNKGERPFDPTFGCDISRQLFENINPAAAVAIKYNIESAVNQHEPRITLTGVVVNPKYDKNTYDVTINYRLVTELNKEYSYSTQLTER